MAPRRFDDYELTLGDEMRGYRAVMSVSLGDVERDLRIRAMTIMAIENADLRHFPNESVIPGYVRSYARYLGMDPEDAYRRFCKESGFRSPTAPVAVASAHAPGAPLVAINNRSGSNLTQSRFAPPAAPKQLGSGISLGAVVSGLALIALVGGLSYGGYHLLQNIQKVGVATLPEAPEIVVDADVPVTPIFSVANVERPDASAYDDDGVLAMVHSGEEPPRLPSRDGPIADLDPTITGLYAPVGRHDPADPRGDQFAPTVEDSQDWNGEVVLASLSSGMMLAEPVSDADRLTMSAAAIAAEQAPAPGRVAVHAVGEAWIRVRDGNGTILFEGILASGESYELPEGLEAPQLRAGNAGDVFVLIGEDAYGPVGRPGRVVKRVALDADSVRESLPPTKLARPEDGDGVQRAAL